VAATIKLLFACADAPAIQILRKFSNRAEFKMAAKYQPYGLSFLRYDHELLVYALVAKRNGTTDPYPLGLGGRDLVSNPFADDLPFELGKRQQGLDDKEI
jgi:hypothetical protein